MTDTSNPGPAVEGSRVPGGTFRREVWLVRRTGDSTVLRYRWACWLDTAAGRTSVRIAAPSEPPPADIDEPAARLHDSLLPRIPTALRAGARSEVGIVTTQSTAGGQVTDRYALATCAHSVVTLVSQLWPRPAPPWRGTCAMAELDPDLPVVLGPSAVLSLAAGMRELTGSPGPARPPEAAAVPDGVVVRAVHRSPYPPHDCPQESFQSLSMAPEQWLRPMRTTRASRGRYEVRAGLPPVAGRPPALWVESLVSLDTIGQYWNASLSVGQDDGRRWLTQPVTVEIRASDLLHAAVGQVEASRPALDHDPIDGESFGWAPSLLTSLTAGGLGLRRGPG